MTKTFLIATVAALAISAPAQAQREDRRQDAESAEAQKKRAERPARTQRAERPAQVQRAERPARVERSAPARVQRAERPARVERTERARVQRAERPARIERTERARVQRAEGPARTQQLSDRRARIQQQVSDRRSLAQQVASDRRSMTQQERSDRRSRFQQRDSDRRSAFQQAASDRRSRVQQLESDRWTWDQRSDRLRSMVDTRQQLRDRSFTRWVDRWDDDDRDGVRIVSIGQRFDPDWWYDDYVPLRYRTSFFYDDCDYDDYYYRYDGDYLYCVDRDRHLISALYPLLGGAFSVGRPLPYAYSSYNVPFGYRSYYYDTPDYYYRYGGGAIYQVDPTTQLIAGIVALLTGQNFGIGQRLPLGYGAYNVPYAYRSTYYDTDDSWYRYNDGYIYEVDPRSRIIEASYPVNGFVVGYPLPAGYDDYNVPYAYRHLYYDTPDYYYRYANGYIYQVDAETRLIASVVALLTGQNLAVGQMLPVGYDAYNVPFAYRDRYYDTDDDLFRYADGYVYRVDPRTRVIRSVITLT